MKMKTKKKKKKKNKKMDNNDNDNNKRMENFGEKKKQIRERSGMKKDKE